MEQWSQGQIGEEDVRLFYYTWEEGGVLMAGI